MPTTVRPAVTFNVYDDEDSTFATPVATLAPPLDGQWLEVLGDYGSGSVTVKNAISDGAGALIANPDLAVLVEDRIVQVNLDVGGGPDPVFWWVVETPDDDKVKPGEENAQQSTFQGKGPFTVLDRVPVYPTLPFDLYPVSPNRVLSWFSPEFDVTSWGTASVIVDSWAETDPTLTLYAGKPSGFPQITGLAKWIGSSTGTQFGDHIGHCFLVKDFTLTDPVQFKIFCAADNRARVYIDGMRVIDIQTHDSTTDGFQKCAEFTIYLSAGTHRLAVHLVNTDFDGIEPPDGPGPVLAGNPMAFIADCWVVAAGSGQFLQRLFGTNTSWKIMEFPVVPPGFTVGQALNILLDQAQADGYVTWINRTWTDSLDSNGDAWDTVPSYGLRVGDLLGVTLKAWIGAGYCDARFSPEAPNLNMYKPGTLGSATAVTYTPGDGVLLSLREKKQAKSTDALIVQWAYGQTYVALPSPTRLGFLAVGSAETLLEAQVLGGAFLAQQSVERVQLDADVRCVTGAVPGVDLVVGDTVTVDGTSERVLRVGGRINDSRGLIPNLTFKDIILTPQERVSLLLQRMVQGTLAGQAPYATPIVPTRPTPKSVGSDELTFHPLDPVQVAESPDKMLSGSTNLFAVKVYCKDGLPAGSDTAFQYLVNGVDVLGGTGVLPSGVDEVLLPITAGTGVDPSVQWVEGNLDRVALNVTTVGALLSDFVVDGWHVV